MSYINAYIEQCAGFGWQGGPVFKTTIVTMANGRENRNSDNAQARHSYALPFNNIQPAGYANIKRMHLVARGRRHTFRFRDELDFEADAAQFAIGDGVETVFQLGKLSTLDGVGYYREVYAIVSAAVTANGSPVSPTIDLDRGTVTFVAPPGNGVVLRWTGIFDIWVRFDQDDLPFSIDNRNAINGMVNLIEDQPPPAP
jgi:uncharacterized protein (TIGR02217 family)